MSPLLYLLCATMGSAAAAGGSSCITVDSEAGRCIKLTECPSLYDLIQSLPLPITQTAAEYLKQSHCGFEGRTPKVCCPHVLSERGTYGDFSSHPNAYLLNAHACGHSIQPRIAEGIEAHINEFPWVALLGYVKGFYCGGSVITERYILTAAHCITDQLRSVRVGEHTIANSTDCEIFFNTLYCAPPYQDFNIEKTIVHALYASRMALNDIALIRVTRAIDFTVSNAMPVCLPIYGNLQGSQFEGKNMTVIGWGFTAKGIMSDVLLKVAVKVVSNNECRKRYKEKRVPAYVMSAKMCAGTLGQDSCRGDSGGPLMYMGVYDNHVRFVQYGIVSYGSYHCGDGTPGIYVKITKYVKWILDHIQP